LNINWFFLSTNPLHHPPLQSTFFTMISATRVMAIATILAGLASAQSGLPSCAVSNSHRLIPSVTTGVNAILIIALKINCVTEFTSGSQIGGCSNINAVCICSNSNFINQIACCLAGACDTADQEAATQYALNFCKAAGVTGLPTVSNSWSHNFQFSYVGEFYSECLLQKDVFRAQKPSALS
jgi:hypothetical protein